eukprot:m.253669 g.253669  ORF g.253669 m.253669 type:complete len:801 (-) comp16162_c0_seq4:682-3084(-)
MSLAEALSQVLSTVGKNWWDKGLLVVVTIFFSYGIVDGIVSVASDNLHCSVLYNTSNESGYFSLAGPQINKINACCEDTQYDYVDILAVMAVITGMLYVVPSLYNQIVVMRDLNKLNANISKELQEPFVKNMGLMKEKGHQYKEPEPGDKGKPIELVYTRDETPLDTYFRNFRNTCNTPWGCGYVHFATVLNIFMIILPAIAFLVVGIKSYDEDYKAYASRNINCEGCLEEEELTKLMRTCDCTQSNITTACIGKMHSLATPWFLFVVSLIGIALSLRKHWYFRKGLNLMKEATKLKPKLIEADKKLDEKLDRENLEIRMELYVEEARQNLLLLKWMTGDGLDGTRVFQIEQRGREFLTRIVPYAEILIWRRTTPTELLDKHKILHIIKDMATRLATWQKVYPTEETINESAGITKKYLNSDEDLSTSVEASHQSVTGFFVDRVAPLFQGSVLWLIGLQNCLLPSGRDGCLSLLLLKLLKKRSSTQLNFSKNTEDKIEDFPNRRTGGLYRFSNSHFEAFFETAQHDEDYQMYNIIVYLLERTALHTDFNVTKDGIIVPRMKASYDWRKMLRPFAGPMHNISKKDPTIDVTFFICLGASLKRVGSGAFPKGLFSENYFSFTNSLDKVFDEVMKERLTEYQANTLTNLLSAEYETIYECEKCKSVEKLEPKTKLFWQDKKVRVYSYKRCFCDYSQFYSTDKRIESSRPKILIVECGKDFLNRFKSPKYSLQGFTFKDDRNFMCATYDFEDPDNKNKCSQWSYRLGRKKKEEKFNMSLQKLSEGKDILHVFYCLEGTITITQI